VLHAPLAESIVTIGRRGRAPFAGACRRKLPSLERARLEESEVVNCSARFVGWPVRTPYTGGRLHGSPAVSRLCADDSPESRREHRTRLAQLGWPSKARAVRMWVVAGAHPTTAVAQP